MSKTTQPEGTMQTREWRWADKSEWGDGPWQDEPDKVQWVDEATGLDCLVVRNHFGALCGYVGVPESHALYGVDYMEESEALAEAWERRKKEPVVEEDWTMPRMLLALGADEKPSPELVFDVHGGLTFSDGCHEPTLDQYERYTELYKKGDTPSRYADRFRKAVELPFEKWAELEMGRRVCHAPTQGRPQKVWWFGFDCGHSGDLHPSPRMAAIREPGGTYKTVEYVKHEVARLAEQLAALS